MTIFLTVNMLHLWGIISKWYFTEHQILSPFLPWRGQKERMDGGRGGREVGPPYWVTSSLVREQFTNHSLHYQRPPWLVVRGGSVPFAAVMHFAALEEGGVTSRITSWYEIKWNELFKENSVLTPFMVSNKGRTRFGFLLPHPRSKKRSTAVNYFGIRGL